MPNLRASAGDVVKGILKPPPSGDELGCKPSDSSCLDLDRDSPCQEEGESKVVQMIRRGKCNFAQKASNHKQAGGIIVINSNPFELFVMAGEVPKSRDSDELPVSVLVSGRVSVYIPIHIFCQCCCIISLF